MFLLILSLAFDANATNGRDSEEPSRDRWHFFSWHQLLRTLSGDKWAVQPNNKNGVVIQGFRR